MSELQNAKRRIKAIRAIRHSTELEGSRSTNATRADQLACALRLSSFFTGSGLLGRQ